MRRLVTISYTGLEAPGGVPKFNRDLHAAFDDVECTHFCWADYPFSQRADMMRLPEHERARALNLWLLSQGNLHPGDDVIVGDGFWVDGLQSLPHVISHSHGIWGHLTKEDADAGKEPENPLLHAAQIAFRKRWTGLGKPLTSVSNFISVEMERQWGFKSTVIKNCVDTAKFIPTNKRFPRHKPIVVHGVNDVNNVNKGWDHIYPLIGDSSYELLSLDTMVEKYGGPKEWALSQADMVVHPSGFEGNSMFVLEALACGVPVCGYDVGYLYGFGTYELESDIGVVMDRNKRSPQMTAAGVRRLLRQVRGGFKSLGRELALTNTFEIFKGQWHKFIEKMIDA